LVCLKLAANLERKNVLTGWSSQIQLCASVTGKQGKGLKGRRWTSEWEREKTSLELKAPNDTSSRDTSKHVMRTAKRRPT